LQDDLHVLLCVSRVSLAIGAEVITQVTFDLAEGLHFPFENEFSRTALCLSFPSFPVLHSFLFFRLGIQSPRALTDQNIHPSPLLRLLLAHSRRDAAAANVTIFVFLAIAVVEAVAKLFGAYRAVKLFTRLGHLATQYFTRRARGLFFDLDIISLELTPRLRP